MPAPLPFTRGTRHNPELGIRPVKSGSAHPYVVWNSRGATDAAGRQTPRALDAEERPQKATRSRPLLRLPGG